MSGAHGGRGVCVCVSDSMKLELAMVVSHCVGGAGTLEVVGIKPCSCKSSKATPPAPHLFFYRSTSPEPSEGQRKHVFFCLLLSS